ncbi:MAG: Crp/Fnr family transcriptional regulator [Bacteroidota bacterium]
MNNRHIKKGEILQAKGELHTRAYFVKKGLVRSYTIDKKGREHIFMFAPEGWIVGDSTLPEDPCELYIDALEDSVIIPLDKDVKTAHDPTKLFNRLRVLQKRVIMLMSASALERYEHFVETYPDIVQRVPQRMIASYLGITPEALSNIKNQYLKRE